MLEEDRSVFSACFRETVSFNSARVTLKVIVINHSRYSLPYEAPHAKSRLDAGRHSGVYADEHTDQMAMASTPNAMGGVPAARPEPYANSTQGIDTKDQSRTLVELEVPDVQMPAPAAAAKYAQYHRLAGAGVSDVSSGSTFRCFPIRSGV